MKNSNTRCIRFIDINNGNITIDEVGTQKNIEKR